jgi:hypothetical protein
MMPCSATIPDLHNASETKIVLSVREKILANNYFFQLLYLLFCSNIFMLLQSINQPFEKIAISFWTAK